MLLSFIAQLVAQDHTLLCHLQCHRRFLMNHLQLNNNQQHLTSFQYLTVLPLASLLLNFSANYGIDANVAVPHALF